MLEKKAVEILEMRIKLLNFQCQGYHSVVYMCLHFCTNNIPDLVGRRRQPSAGVNTGQSGHWHTQINAHKILGNTLRITYLYNHNAKSYFMP